MGPDAVKTPFRPLAAFLLAALLAGCATTERLSAASDVHALLVSIRDDDRRAFDAHIDKPALEAQIQAQIVARARASGAPDIIKGIGLYVSGPLSRAAGSALIRPDFFRAVAEYYGYRPGTPIPNVVSLASVLRPLADGRVCAIDRKKGPCLLTFADEGGVWRLVGFDVARAGFRGR